MAGSFLFICSAVWKEIRTIPTKKISPIPSNAWLVKQTAQGFCVIIWKCCCYAGTAMGCITALSEYQCNGAFPPPKNDGEGRTSRRNQWASQKCGADTETSRQTVGARQPCQTEFAVWLGKVWGCGTCRSARQSEGSRGWKASLWEGQSRAPAWSRWTLCCWKSHPAGSKGSQSLIYVWKIV